jgi:hypothetical protein
MVNHPREVTGAGRWEKIKISFCIVAEDISFSIILRKYQ